MNRSHNIPDTNSSTIALLRFAKDATWFVLKFCFVVMVVLSPIMLLQWAVPRFVPSPNVTLNTPAFAPYLPIFFVSIFVYGFFAVSFAIAEMSGWRKLATRFRAPRKFVEGELFKRQSGSFGVLSYSHVLKIRLSPAGLYIACIFPFSVSHPALLIP